MTNFEYIISSPEVLGEFLDDIAFKRETPWAASFSKTFCENCPTEKVRIKVQGKFLEEREEDWCECDFPDGICPHGDDVHWWLNQEYKPIER
jgi:hypothetical protein